jgi:hypothetical protein
MTKDNHKLGQFDLKGIPPAPRGTPQVRGTRDGHSPACSRARPPFRFAAPQPAPPHPLTDPHTPTNPPQPPLRSR